MRSFITDRRGCKGREMRLESFVQCSMLGLALLLAGGLPAGCGPAPQAAWSTMAGPYPQMLFSVWGTSGSDVWAVGGTCNLAADCPSTSSSLVLHYDGATWSPVTAPTSA